MCRGKCLDPVTMDPSPYVSTAGRRQAVHSTVPEGRAAGPRRSGRGVLEESMVGVGGKVGQCAGRWGGGVVCIYQ